MIRDAWALISQAELERREQLERDGDGFGCEPVEGSWRCAVHGGLICPDEYPAGTATY